MEGKLAVLQLNLNSIRARATELRYHLSRGSYDVLCLQETKLGPNNGNVKLIGYTCLRSDRPGVSKGGEGGLAIYIKEGVVHEDLTLNVKELEGQGAVIHMSDGTKIAVINIYSPPNREVVNGYQYLYDHIKYPRILICGDFNAHHALWGSKRTDRRGRVLYSFMEDNGLCVLNDGSPTCFRPGCEPSHIDLTLASPAISSYCDWTIGNDDTFGSDHLAITIILLDKSPYRDNTDGKKNLENEQSKLGPLQPTLPRVEGRETGVR
ncbi:hypothetical protein SNE40_005159 [Patella caerulea]|uniref:Endonuclease/exonuclease/phosphatase domain-containing protein n=1 Tax=Patella caerulea TaxID=87958 RepID=A0AAN8KDS4_PATCE